MIFPRVCFACAVAIMVGPKASWAWDASEVRKTIQAHSDAIITVQLVAEITSTYEGSSEKHQSKITAPGTVIDPSGLTVASLSQTNPAETASRMWGSDEDFQVSSRAVDVKIRMPDGTEIPADFVLRDADLDLAFLRPKKAPERPMTYVDIGQYATLDVLDEVLILTRLGPAASRALSVSLERVRAVLTKPRTLYLLGPSALNTSLGGAAFTVDGKCVGITTLRLSSSKDSGLRLRGGTEDIMAVVILPSSTVAEIAQKAKKASPIKENASTARPADKPLPKKSSAK